MPKLHKFKTAMSESREVFIIDAVRTPVGRFLGALKKHEAHELGAITVESLLKRTGEKSDIKPSEIDSLIFGQVLVAGKKQNPARNAAVKGGLPVTCPAHSVSIVCGSGLRSIQLARNEILAGDAELVIAGGMESMSRSTHAAYLRDGQKYFDLKLEDTMFLDGLTDTFKGYQMGMTCENIVSQENISREVQDQFAVESHARAVSAIENGYMEKEIIAVGEVVKDEQPRKQDLQRLAKMKPHWLPDSGSVTAGNASTLNDGAAAVLLGTNAMVKRLNCKPLAKILAQTMVGIDPSIMGLGPVSAVEKLLKKLNWKIEDVDLFELNEAFAGQAIACLEKLKIPSDKCNINGGAIAIGHPIGASGARILVTLLYALQRLNKKHGIAALCIGGGMSVAIAVECIDRRIHYTEILEARETRDKK